MTPHLPIILHAPSLETTSGVGPAVDLWGEDGVQLRRFARLTLLVSALVGSTPTVGVSVEISPDGESWGQLDAFPSQVVSGMAALTTGDLERFVRVQWVLGEGTTSAVFAVRGEARSTFCTLAELADLGIAGERIAQLPKDTRILQLLAASLVAHGYVVRRAMPPILSVGEDLARAVAQMASAAMLTGNVGINPNPEATALALAEASAQRRWLADVSRGIAEATFSDSTPEAREGTGAVSTGRSLGWDSDLIQ